ncbi:amidohydrolase family protein [Mucilaginibacter flavidus]|uniref:amidohydrolase family protein n=1 Tax=Mucilaginibacter flavidus TaxID=2949309 RepID=UPI003519BDCA
MRWGTVGDKDPCRLHARIRSQEACAAATERVLAAAGKYANRLHLLHISTLAEALLLDDKRPVRNKRVTAEACLPHLYFSDQDYQRLGNSIKWNPAIKTSGDKQGLLYALLTGHLDIIATDHAPHLPAEKKGGYLEAKSGGPLVQHALQMLMELCRQGQISLTQIVEKTSHHVAEVYRIPDRGYIREGYYADLVLVDPGLPATVTKDTLYYKCGWSPLEGQTFQSSVIHTWVNGRLVFNKEKFDQNVRGMRLHFEKVR